MQKQCKLTADCVAISVEKTSYMSTRNVARELSSVDFGMNGKTSPQ